MSLSNTLFETISKELKLKASLLTEERDHVKSLKSQSDMLKKAKEIDYRKIALKSSIINQELTQDLIVMYIISISFLKANTTIHISDAKGNVKLFYSAGSVGLTGRQKRKRRVAVLKLISLMLQRARFLSKSPIALHLNNVSFYKDLIVGKLKQTLYIRAVKSFNQIPYNGCRKKKIRRKKYIKKFK